MITGPVQTIKRARKLRSDVSWPDLVLWRQLRGRPDRFKFRRQHPAGIYVLDFYCAALRLAIEVDGAVHDGSDVARHDEIRSASLRPQHVATMRNPAKAVLKDVEAVDTRIVELCRTGRTRMASALPPVPHHQPAAGPPPHAGEEQESS